MNEVNIMLLGEGNVGKTSILLRYFTNKYEDMPISTTDEYEKVNEINGRKMLIKAYENCGESDPFFPDQIYEYYKKCDGAIFVFDIGNIKSIDPYFDHIYNFFKRSKKKFFFSIAANKVDLKTNVNYSEINKIEEKYKCKVITTSAKENINIDYLFQETINKIINQLSYHPTKNGIISKCMIE